MTDYTFKIREYFEQLYANKLTNQDEQISRKTQLTQEETRNPKSSVSIKVTELVIKIFSKRKLQAKRVPLLNTIAKKFFLRGWHKDQKEKVKLPLLARLCLQRQSHITIRTKMKLASGMIKN